MNIQRIKRDNERYRKANPWRMVNVQNSQAMSGRFPTKEAAISEASRRGGLVGIEGNDVLFSEMPRL